MSAITGIMSLDGAPLAPDLIGTLTQSMASRGPDGIQHWTNGNVALGHCSLRNTPESLLERQPLISSNANFVLVFDGRLDNRLELIKSLEQHNISLKSLSDAELVLGAFEIWVNDCPAHLLGDFAFAILDIHRQKLFCARDHVGARQFYYVINENFFAFASGDETLLNVPGVSNEPYAALIASLLVPEFKDIDPQQTWLKDVRALLPAHFITSTSTGVSVPKSYWQFELGAENKYANDQECKEAFLGVFGDAVKSRLRLVGEPAAIISGGMDSAGLLAMMNRLMTDLPGGQYHTYSATADDPAMSLESRCIQSMTQHDQIVAHSVSVPSFTGMLDVDDLIKIAWTNTHPVDNSILLVASMCLAASRNGHRVLLHGVSGDLAMGGSDRYIASLLRSYQWHTGWQECKAAAQNHTYLSVYSPLQILLQNALKAFLPQPVKKQLRRIRSWLHKTRPDMGVLNPDFVKKLNLVNRLDSQVSHFSNDLETGFRHQRAASIFGQNGVISGLSGYQRAASQYGVEMRDPWADKRVLEFFLHLPPRHLVRNGWTKYLTRSTFERELGKSVVWRNDKEHLGWLYGARLMDECTEFVEYLMNDELALIENYVDLDKIRDMYCQYKSSKDGTNMTIIYDIVTLIQWVKRL